MQQTQPYEFNDEQNRVIGSLGTRMVAVGGVQLLLGLVLLALAAMLLLAWQKGLSVGPPGMPAWMPGAAVGVVALLPILMGGWVRSAGGSFARIAQSQSRDMWHLMNALGSLDSAFGLARTLVLVVIILSLILTFVAGAAAFGLLK